MNLQDYYMTADLHEPTHFNQREFGVFTKNSEFMWRHLTFKDVNELRAFLINQQPSHVYFSAARYKEPGNKDMMEKRLGRIGMDLVFDIDNDHLENPTLGEAAFMAISLVGVLRNSYGLKDITLVFSGSRGYHVHVRDNCIQDLNKYERRQIIDDIVSRGIEIDVQVTDNMSHLIRLPGTIHSKTGKACSIVHDKTERIG